MLFLKYDRFRMAQFKDEADKPLKLRVLDDEKLATFKTRIHQTIKSIRTGAEVQLSEKEERGVE